MVMNPKRKKSRKRRSRPRRARRARARSNPANPRRRRRRSTFRRRRARARRNPGLALPRIGGLDLGEVAWGVGGAVLSDVGGNVVAGMLPAQAQNPLVRYAVKGGLILGGSMLLGRFVGRSAAKTMALGGAILLGLNAFREYVQPSIPFLNGYSEEYPSLVSGYALQPALSGLGADGGWSDAWSDG